MLKLDKVIVVGSGPSVSMPSRIPENVTVMAVNHGWMHGDFDIWFRSSDFSGKRPKLQSHQFEVENYIKELLKYGGPQECGQMVVLNALYWLAAHKTKMVGMLGCDMNYEPVDGATHVYGIGEDVKAGEPDPFRAEREHGKSIKQLYERVQAVTGMSVFNLSKVKKTMLPVPRTTPTKFFKL